MDDSDPFFLDWGSSVNVNEDLRRSIQSEINSLDQEIRHLDNSISKEENISSQLRKDYSHAQAELINLRRGACDEKDNAAMNEQIQMRLGESLQKELVEVLSKSSSHPADIPPSTNGAVSTSGSDHYSNNRRADPQKILLQGDSCENYDLKSAVTDLPMKEYIETRMRDIENLKAKIHSKRTLLDGCRSNLAELQFQLAQTNEHVAHEQKHQSVWNSEIEVITKEYDTEKQRIKNIKDSLSNSRKNVGDWTQQDAACMTLLNTLRESNSRQESELQSNLAASEAIVSELSREVDRLSASLASTTKHINLLHDQFLQRESIIEEQETVKQETLKVNQQIDVHRKREMELKKLISEARHISETQEIELGKAKKEMSNIDLLRASNDEEEEALTSLRDEFPKIAGMNDGLSREIGCIQDTIVSINQSNHSELSSIERHLKDISKQVVEKTNEVREKRNILESNQSLLRELNKATLEEVEQHRNLKANFDAAYDTQLKLIVRKEMDIAKTRAERLESRRLERLSEEISLEKLQCGVQLIQDAERIEKEYMEKIRHLQEKVM